MADPNEAELLQRAKKGDRVAYAALVRMHQRRVYALSLQMLASQSEAEDAVQETFIRAWRALARFDGRSELSTWLYRIGVNVCLNALRRRKRNAADDLHDPRVPEPIADATQGRTDPASTAEASQLQGRLAKALDQLSPSLRTTVILVLVQGVPHKEAAEVLGCPEGTIAWRIHEARRKLREALRDVLDDAEARSSARAEAADGAAVPEPGREAS